MKTIEQRISAKAEIIARKCKADIEQILVWADDDRDSVYFGNLMIEFKTWKGPKIVEGNLSDYDDTLAINTMRTFLRDTFGLELEIESNDDGVDLFRVIFG